MENDEHLWDEHREPDEGFEPPNHNGHGRESLDGEVQQLEPAEEEEPTFSIADARQALEPARLSLVDAGFYAYGTLDNENRWTIAADDEAGHIDVRVGADGLRIELWASSPGLYADEENEFRRRTLERLARMTIPNVARGFLADHQHAVWDEVDRGVAVRLHYELPFTRVQDIGQFARRQLDELEEVLTFVERQVTS